MKPRVPASKYKSFIAFVDFLKSNNATQFFQFLKRDVFYEDPEWWISHAFTWYRTGEDDGDFWLDLHYRWVEVVGKLQREQNK